MSLTTSSTQRGKNLPFDGNRLPYDSQRGSRFPSEPSRGNRLPVDAEAEVEGHASNCRF